MLYTHDGAGLGHLSRLSKIAAELASDEVHCLIVSGFREMTYFVSVNVDFIKLPSIDSMLSSKSKYWNRKPFMDLNKREVLNLRKSNIEKLVKLYKPNAFIVDFFPLGKYGELINIFEKWGSISFYNLQRGIIGSKKIFENDIFTSQNVDYLIKHFKSILVVNDSRIFDFSSSYPVPDELKHKIITTGYIANRMSDFTKEQIRNQCGIKKDQKWIICTAGGGKLGENFIRQVLSLPVNFPDCQFDVIAGYRSSFEILTSGMDNLRFHHSVNNLSDYIGASDICVTTGGYNTITESLANNTHILIWPSQIDDNDEQYLHSVALRKILKYDPLIDGIEQLGKKLRLLINDRRIHDIRSEINLDGIQVIKKVIYNDLLPIDRQSNIKIKYINT